MVKDGSKKRHCFNAEHNCIYMPLTRSFSFSSLVSSESTNEMEGHNGCYPYNRKEECSWQPISVESKLSDLLSLADDQYRNLGLEEDMADQHLINRGWSTKQARVLRQLFGKNVVEGKKEDDNLKCFNIPIPKIRRLMILFPCFYPIISSFMSQFNEPLNIMLLVSAAISLILKQTSDAISIGLALTIVCIVAAVQEYRSEAALEKLVDLVPHTCTVMRDGRVRDRYPAKDLVVGDSIVLSTGDRVPADCRLVDSVELTVDESSLTGENTSITKSCAEISIFSADNSDPPLTAQRNIVFMGSLVCSGRGRAIIIAVGNSTEFGKVAEELGSIESRKSPLQVKIDELGKTLAITSSVVIALMALLGWFLGRPFLETATVAVSLAVAAIPEGLPICVTVTLALGVLKMARSNAIIKKLTSVESLGCTTLVASDKTGTLTKNEMTARSIYSPAHPQISFGLTGVGYDPSEGHMTRINQTDNMTTSSNGERNEGDKVLVSSIEFVAIQTLFQIACICNNASISLAEDNISNFESSGQPTEIALIVGASKCKVEDPRPQYHRMQEIPFSSDRKRMEVRARPINGNQSCLAFSEALIKHKTATPNGSLYFVKGMPEAVLGECKSHIIADGSTTNFTETVKMQVLSQSRWMASSGLRVLAMAYGPSIDNLIFAGLIGMEDPPREGVAEAVHKLQKSGVSVLMITGDSKETALAIGKQCGIIGSGQCTLEMNSNYSVEYPSSQDPLNVLEYGSACLSGEQIDAIPKTRLAESILGVKIFYRVAPRHKLALVRAFQSQREVVLMTGDGVNDAPALKAADIGVAMGKGGTAVAQEAADVVLADDDFSTILGAIAGGKGIFFNIRNFLSFQLSTSFAALSMECISTIVGLPSPLNAMQILFINLIMDGPPAQSLGVEPVGDKILRARPRRATDPLLTRALLLRAISSAILIVFVTLKVFVVELDGGSVTRRDTTMTFMTFVNCDLFNAYACRSSDRCFHELNLFENPAFLFAVGGSVVGQLAVIYFRPLQEVFQTEALSMSDLLMVLMISSSVLVLDTMRKKIFPRWFTDDTMKTFSSKTAYKLKKDSTVSIFSDKHNISNIKKRTARSRTVHI